MVDSYKDITLTAVGDMMLAEEVIIRRSESVIARNCAMDNPFKYTSGLLKESHITFGNLECPLCIRGVPDKDKDVVAKGSPEYIHDLVKAGFNVVSIANNHIMDYGPEGLFDTLGTLARFGIKTVGAGKDLKAARKHVCLEINGIKVAIMAYYGSTQTSRNLPGAAAGKFSVVKMDLARLKRSADIIVISFHWGIEYLDTPPSTYVTFARNLIEAGAHLILGHHPHILQGIEQHRNGVIAYSLGNFVFDTTIHPVNLPQTKEGMILKCYLSKYGIQHYELIPVYINDNSQPEILTGRDKERILASIERLNDNLNNPEVLEHADNRLIDTGLNFLFNRGLSHFLRQSWRGLCRYPLGYTLRVIIKLLKRIFKT